MSIDIENLSFSYGKHEVIRNLSCTVYPEKLTALLGPNGVGKSTLFKCILGLCDSYSGKIFINGTDASKLSAREKAKLIAYIPQSNHTVFNFTVFDMVMMGTAHQVSALSSPSKKEIEQTENAIAKVGIEHLAHRSFHNLSGGEQQLVLIARALAQQTKILLMDEPTSALDYGNQIRILQKIRGLRADGYTVLMSSHNPQHALTYSDRIIAVSTGEIAADGETQSVLTTQLIKKLYDINAEFIETPYGKVMVPVTFAEV